MAPSLPLGVPPDWFRRLAALPGAFWLRDGASAYCGALPDARSSAVDPEPSLPLPQFHAGAQAFPRWVGVLPYEAFRQIEGETLETRPVPLLERIEWLRYRAVLRVSSGGVELLADSDESRLRLLHALEVGPVDSKTPHLQPLGAVETDALHLARIQVALERIARGELYQVNLARRYEFSAEGSALALLSAFSASAASPGPELGDARCAFALELGHSSVVSLSPELFLTTRAGGVVETTPIKGTRPRAADPKLDAEQARELEASEKERAELTMVIDLERNDLGRVCQPGSVILLTPPRVVSHETVHHREATVAGVLRSGIQRAALIEAMMPSGSVTGAPKRAAMSSIAELEAHRRGLYTGAHGYIGQDGSLHLSMAIRCLVVRGGLAHYFAGGGIVADSQPEAEVEETRWKAEQLARLTARPRD